ncbi:xanthine dehydrogenase family protein molybdopterin-binding subunit [Marivita hallyeonensis]|uniref:Carbon-monoxide dehydrogenase large subunit n=1 Tax=Marivita hallyeonensis TaxID=996342 RepID=A0A1M5P6P4_9RHOB|nr:xanthine dehydrogenase family protein molybdopterin-binding subunit [Marivita hallyeonensis]SHG97460.1 carbon-monoxide dehydrogenase large subunit [Marivita hallyeonensis]
MEKFGKSQPVKRVEDIRFLTGAGRYVDDIAPEDALRGYVFRSPVAHATVDTLDVTDARQIPGVQLVLTAQDLTEMGITEGMWGTTVPNRDGTKGAAPFRPLLATDTVRYVGEPVAFIVAETLEAARDAAEAIEFDYTEKPVHLAHAVGGEALHSVAPDNRAFDWGMGDETATQAAFDAAHRTVSLDVEDNRIIVNAMEPRGCYAEMEGDRVHLSLNAQGVWSHKTELARVLNVTEDAIRVTNPDVGGGFGMKAMPHNENFLVAIAAKHLDRPVRWMSERTEGMLSDSAGRDLNHTAELAFDANNRITAYRVHTVANMGAYNSHFAQAIQTSLFSKVLMGVYDVQTSWLHVEGVYTNTTPVDAYRGAGRPEAIYLLERVIDRAARELDIDPWDLRRINFIKPHQFPYKTTTGETYDVGDFDRVLDSIARFADKDGFESRRSESQSQGKLRGLGLCYYIESILGAPTEDVKVTFDEDGGASIYVGTQSNGQGHETVFTQFLSDQTGIPADKIRFVQGDSDLIARGGGTGGSRSVTIQNTATLAAVDKMITAFTAFLAEQQDVPQGDISFDDEQFRVGTSNVTPTMLEVAQMAREAGREDLLTFDATVQLDARSFPNGAHVAEVEIDPETGHVTVERYTVVDDFGNLINPMLAEGQVHGGVVQGVGQALTERVVYDEDGQLLTATFMDYAMPRADDVPMIGFSTEATPSTTNPMGMKGCGEAGTVGALAAVANAVQDAMWAQGVRQADMPFTPQRVWGMLQDARVAAE